jgi:hypothetical protein
MCIDILKVVECNPESQFNTIENLW